MKLDWTLRDVCDATRPFGPSVNSILMSRVNSWLAESSVAVNASSNRRPQRFGRHSAPSLDLVPRYRTAGIHQVEVRLQSFRSSACNDSCVRSSETWLNTSPIASTAWQSGSPPNRSSR